MMIREKNFNYSLSIYFNRFKQKFKYILNRWYLWDNNTHPTENHKYFEFYTNH